MAKISKLIILTGLCFMCLGTIISAFNFNKLLSPYTELDGPYEERTIIIDNENLQNLIIDVDNVPIYIVPTKDEKVKITYYESKRTKFTTKETKDSFTFKSKHKFIVLDMDFSFLFFDNKVTIEVPENMILSYDIKTDNGRIEIKSLTVSDSKFETNNGRIKASSVKSDNGLEFRTSNGQINLTGVRAFKILAKTNNGSINLKRVNTLKSINATTDNGRITLENLTSPNIKLTTNNGRVTGNILGDEIDYSRDLKTDNGHITINGTRYADKIKDRQTKNKSLYIKTDNGNIDIDIY